MNQPSPVADPPFLERLRTEAGRRAFGIGLALLVEALLLLMLLSLGSKQEFGAKERGIVVVDVRSSEVLEEAPTRPEPQEKVEQRDDPTPPAPDEPVPTKRAEPLPMPFSQPVPQPPPSITLKPQGQPPAAAPPTPPASPAKRVYGPPDTGGSTPKDTERVGTAPNGEPLYAAAWYREPKDADLRSYLSTARGPGWGLIACRTAPDYRVEDCVALEEYPEGSQINRAVLAAAWEFRVRPPRLGGRLLVGSWVRIRIDYGIEPR